MLKNPSKKDSLFLCEEISSASDVPPPYIPSSLITPLPFGEGLGVRLFGEGLGVRLFLYSSCLKDFLFGIVDFLELAFGSPFDIVAKGGYTVGMMLESKLAVGSLDLLVSG